MGWYPLWVTHGESWLLLLSQNIGTSPCPSSLFALQKVVKWFVLIAKNHVCTCRGRVQQKCPQKKVYKWVLKKQKWRMGQAGTVGIGTHPMGGMGKTITIQGGWC